MENQNPASFNFHCYSFDSLLGLDSIREFLEKNYKKQTSHLELDSRAYENVSKSFNELASKKFNLQGQLDNYKANDASLSGMAYDSLECDDEPMDEDTSEITRAIYEALEDEYKSSEKNKEGLEFLKPMGKDDLLGRMKGQYGKPFLPRESQLKDELTKFGISEVSPERFKRRFLSMHLQSSFWSIPHIELSFQTN